MSQRSINSVLEDYEPSFPRLEPYSQVFDERNELRQQNKQLWRIIEKQRAIIYQLQKLTKKDGKGGSISSSKTSKKEEGTLLEEPSDAKVEANGEEADTSNDKEGSPGKVSPDIGRVVEQEYTRAQKTQSILYEKYQHVQSENEVHESIYNTSPSATRDMDQQKVDDDKPKDRPRSSQGKGDEVRYIRKTTSDSKINHMSGHGSTLNGIKGMNPSAASQPNLADTSSGVEGKGSKLAIPPRSSLRNRNEPSEREKDRKGLPTIAEREEKLKPPNRKIPDLRKNAVKSTSEPSLNSNDSVSKSLHSQRITFNPNQSHPISIPTAPDHPEITQSSQDDLDSDFESEEEESAEYVHGGTVESFDASSIHSMPTQFTQTPATLDHHRSNSVVNGSFLAETASIRSSLGIKTHSHTSSQHSIASIEYNSIPRGEDSTFMFPDPPSEAPPPEVSPPFESNHLEMTQTTPHGTEFDLEDLSFQAARGSNLPQTPISETFPQLDDQMTSDNVTHCSLEDLPTNNPTAYDETEINPSLTPALSKASSLTRKDSKNRGGMIMASEASTLNRKVSQARSELSESARTNPPQSPTLANDMTIDDRIHSLRQLYTQLEVRLVDRVGECAVRLAISGQPKNPLPVPGMADKPKVRHELWRVNKLIRVVEELDNKLRPDYSDLSTLPSLTHPNFNALLQDYLTQLLTIQSQYISQFLSTDLVYDDLTPLPPVPTQGHSRNNSQSQSITQSQMGRLVYFKAGKMLKRGKKLGKLKLRYFVIDGTSLEYFESENGPYLGSITIYKAQIIRSKVASLHSEQFENYVYAITVMEPKKNTLTKHTFFVDNAKDWDEWIFTLDHFAHLGDPISEGAKPIPPIKHMTSGEVLRINTNLPDYEGGSTSGGGATSPDSQLPPEPEIVLRQKKSKVLEFMDGVKAVRKDPPAPSATLLPPTSGDKSKTSAKRKTFHWNTKNFFADAFKKPSGPGKVFGVPLEQSILKGSVKDGLHLPAVVFRCIEFLEKHQAFLEEGIYRLSGSSADIQHLRDKFDNDGDYNLVKSGARYDVHTVAGLLKLYLRELPTYVLTAELQGSFLKAIDIVERHEKVNELGRLVCALPLANYTILRTIIAHLIRIVERSEVNLMTLRNIGIVFVPTLAIPAGVFSLMILEFEHIFWVNEFGDATPNPVSHGYPGSHLAQEIEATQPTKPAQRLLRTNEGWRDNRNSILYQTQMPEELKIQEHGLDTSGKEVADMELIGEGVEVDLSSSSSACSSIILSHHSQDDGSFPPSQFVPSIRSEATSSIFIHSDVENLPIPPPYSSSGSESDIP